MSPSTTTVLCPRSRASRNVSIAFETLFGLALYASSSTVIPVAASRETRMRPFGDANAANLAPTSESGTPVDTATAAAHAAHAARCAPGSERHTETVSFPFRIRSALGGNTAVRSSARSSSERAASTSTSAPLPRVPKDTLREPFGTVIPMTRASSAFTTHTSPSEADANISAFARATPSRSPTPSRCAGATFVTTRTFGLAIAASAAISPGALMPISSTHARADGGARRIVSGSPTWLLKFPSVACVCSSPSASAHMSRAVVFPTLPVIPTTGPSNRRRTSDASAWSAAVAFSTRT
mmetsp:Transcript_4306/g.18306  ORF Transcript_4306/g.18306 Transcript_4306/m.18306 type:complete len:297 (-) Transcript_4306:245-1135(-)